LGDGATMVQNVRFGPEGSRLAGANLEKRGTRLRASGSSPEAGGVGGGTWGHFGTIGEGKCRR
jgi:hypothetical protein